MGRNKTYSHEQAVQPWSQTLTAEQLNNSSILHAYDYCCQITIVCAKVVIAGIHYSRWCQKLWCSKQLDQTIKLFGYQNYILAKACCKSVPVAELKATLIRFYSQYNKSSETFITERFAKILPETNGQQNKNTKPRLVDLRYVS